LSPFRDGDNEIQKFISEEPGLRGGTVHKAQGKEADVVIFILGSNPNKPATRKWASQRPNLVNVAVSRARQRLYVIGDFALWSEFPYFRELARHLKRRQ
jgi:superfamily I DNA and/or RNA helicase